MFGYLEHEVVPVRFIFTYPLDALPFSLIGAYMKNFAAFGDLLAMGLRDHRPKTLLLPLQILPNIYICISFLYLPPHLTSS